MKPDQLHEKEHYATGAFTKKSLNSFPCPYLLNASLVLFRNKIPIPFISPKVLSEGQSKSCIS